MRELGRHLVVEAQVAGLHHLVVLQAERQQHGLLDPLVHGPLADAFAGGHAQLAVVQLGDHVLDGIAHFLAVRWSAERLARFSHAVVDDLLELLGH